LSDKNKRSTGDGSKSTVDEQRRTGQNTSDDTSSHSGDHQSSGLPRKRVVSSPSMSRSAVVANTNAVENLEGTAPSDEKRLHRKSSPKALGTSKQLQNVYPEKKSLLRESKEASNPFTHGSFSTSPTNISPPLSSAQSHSTPTISSSHIKTHLPHSSSMPHSSTHPSSMALFQQSLYIPVHVASSLTTSTETLPAQSANPSSTATSMNPLPLQMFAHLPVVTPSTPSSPSTPSPNTTPHTNSSPQTPTSEENRSSDPHRKKQTPLSRSKKKRGEKDEKEKERDRDRDADKEERKEKDSGKGEKKDKDKEREKDPRDSSGSLSPSSSSPSLISRPLTLPSSSSSPVLPKEPLSQPTPLRTRKTELSSSSSPTLLTSTQLPSSGEKSEKKEKDTKLASETRPARGKRGLLKDDGHSQHHHRSRPRSISTSMAKDASLTVTSDESAVTSVPLAETLALQAISPRSSSNNPNVDEGDEFRLSSGGSERSLSGRRLYKSSKSSHSQSDLPKIDTGNPSPTRLHKSKVRRAGILTKSIVFLIMLPSQDDAMVRRMSSGQLKARVLVSNALSRSIADPDQGLKGHFEGPTGRRYSVACTRSRSFLESVV